MSLYARTASAVTMLLIWDLGAALAQGNPVRPLFETDAPLELTIEAPLRQLSRSQDDRAELDSLVRYRMSSGREIVLDAEIRVRGRSRLEYFCDFPPLRVDFDREQTEGTVFAGQNHLKLVTHCRRLDSYREYLALEYQIYEAFNALTDSAFRVRWASIEYVDTDSRRRASFTEPAFFIEEDWEVAERTGMEVLDVPTLEIAQLDARKTTLLALFQYMIGNTDWSALRPPPGDSCCHNTKPIGRGDAGIVVLPYDFDHSGLVAAEYARPRSHLPIRSVRQRLYRGYCATNGELDWAITHLNERRSAIERVFDSERVQERRPKMASDYIAEFYELVNDNREKQQLVEGCRAF